MTEEKNGEVTRDSTRTSLLNGYIRKSEIFTTDDGVSIEIKQPTVGQRSRMLKAGGITGATSSETADLGKMQIAAVIECCYLPGTGKKLFEWTDLEVLEALPTTSWFDQVASVAMNLMNVEPEEAGKPSSETTSDSPSSSSQKSSAEL
tara:strand:- start:46 stop:489 length:444 start_codon:yes stop_codon:yes gene_type:complete